MKSLFTILSLVNIKNVNSDELLPVN
uniref:Uncharacterized protein n=1 Tax=Anguilla anguilla TaxID=7936 RepID=A0A0E9SBJ5_ANGAN